MIPAVEKRAVGQRREETNENMNPGLLGFR